jgi:hypothetical protein
MRPRRRRFDRWLAGVATIALLAAGLLAGCGGSSGEDADASGGTGDRAVRFAECMREHGVPDFPDPEGPGRLLVPRTIDVQSPQFEQARQACQGELRGSG